MNPPISDGKSFSEEARMALPVPEAGGGLLLALSFLGTASFLGGMGLVLALYLWTVNRSAQLKRTKGSVAGYRGEKVGRGRGEGGEGGGADEEDDEEDVDDNESGGNDGDGKDEGEDLAGGPPGSATRRERRRGRSSSRAPKWFLSFEVDPDDDASGEEEEEREERRRRGERTRAGSRSGNGSDPMRPSMGGLAEVASTVKVFSYLGREALAECLNHAAYVDVPAGSELFGRGQFDGSLYVVLAGCVRCRFHDYAVASSDGDGMDGVLSFDTGPGAVVTPLLAMLEAIVRNVDRENKDEDEGEDEGGKGPNGPTGDGLAGGAPLSMAGGVSAVATSDARLLRVSASAYPLILRMFPADVHRVATTIVQRVQRVTLQILVRTLGLRSELLRRGAAIEERVGGPAVPPSSPGWGRIRSALEGGGGGTAEAAASALPPSLVGDAAAIAAEELGLPPSCAPALGAASRLVALDDGEVLIRTGTADPAVYLLLGGRMRVGIEPPSSASASASASAAAAASPPPPVAHGLSEVGPGTIVGRLSCFSGDVSLITARAVSAGVHLLRIPKETLDGLLVDHPMAMVDCFEYMLSLLSPSVHLINWCSQWTHVQASEVVARRGDVCDSMFMVLNGRIRATKSSPGGGTTYVEEFGRGRCIGDVAGITMSRWPGKVYAIRNSELAKVPIRALEAIIRCHPKAGLHFARGIASRVRHAQEAAPGLGLGKRRVVLRRGGGAPVSRSASLMPSYGLSLATVAVVPLVADVDISGFCRTLALSMGRIAPSKLLTKEKARRQLGAKVYRHHNPMHEAKMTRYLGEIEEKYRLVLYEADQKYTWWTRICISQADTILLLVKADQAPEYTRVEQCLEWAFKSMHVQIELVVVDSPPQPCVGHSELEMDVSDQLDNWSEARPWISGHHLARAPFASHEEDVQRMCRRVTGLSVGLVLGGGGARGLAHLGVIRALIEAGVQVDMVGGTSQGAYIGALYARSPDNFDLVMERARQMAVQMSSTKEKLLDLTLPMTSMFSGYRFNAGISASLGQNTRIQDLVLKFFCVSTDIQKSRMAVHTKGTLWKYVRASMSLMGYLPPISLEGSLLADGGYMNCIPSDVMFEQFGARQVISVDVAGEAERDYYEYGTHLSGWWLLWNSLNPFVATVKVPSMGDLSNSLRWVSSDVHRRRTSSASDLHLDPPIKNFGTLEFDKFDEIVEKGYLYAKPIIDEYVRKNPGIASK